MSASVLKDCETAKKVRRGGPLPRTRRHVRTSVRCFGWGTSCIGLGDSRLSIYAFDCSLTHTNRRIREREYPVFQGPGRSD